MSIEQRTDSQGRTRYRAKVRVKDPESGGWATVNEDWTRSQDQAARDERKLLRRRDAGNLAPARGVTTAGYLIGTWLPATSAVSKRGRPLAPTTRMRYRSDLETACEVIGDIPLVDLRAHHIERLRDQLMARGTMGPTTVSTIMRTVGQGLRRAVAKGLIHLNPADAGIVDRPHGRPKARPIVTPDIGKAVLRAARGQEPWDVAAHLGLGLSLRREEVLGLGWQHIDLDAGTLRVERTLTYGERQLGGGRELVYGPPKSDAGERTLPLPGFVADALRRHRAAQAGRRLILGPDWPLQGDVDDLVVERGGGEPWLPATFSTYWTRWTKAQGFQDLPFHQLRRGTATLLLAAGVPDPVVIGIMGHADVRILRVYQDVVPALTVDAMARLDALLAE